MITETSGVGGDGSQEKKPVDEDAYRKMYNEKLKPDADKAQEEREKKREELVKAVAVLQAHIEEQKDKVTGWRVLLSRGETTVWNYSSAKHEKIQDLMDNAVRDIKFNEGLVSDNQKRLSEMGL
jgi:hypothetical protein